MNHPGQEEWMSYLYSEIPRAEKSRLADHLKHCAKCREKVSAWQGAMNSLDTDKIVPRRAPAPMPQPMLKWAIAAALVLLASIAAFGVGRLTARPVDTQALRESLRSELLADLKQQQEQQFAQYKASDEETRALDKRAIFAAMGKIEADRLADSAVLHKEVETVAVNTQDSFQLTHQQIATLANYNVQENKPITE